MRRYPSWVYPVLGLALACLAILAWLAPVQRSRTSHGNGSPTPEKSVPLELVTPHLSNADARINEAVHNHFLPVRALLNRGRSNTDKFAKLALGWSSKWRIATDAIPFTKGGSNERYLKEQFELHVLNGEELQRAIEQCVNEFIAEVHSIESKMLVDLQADVQGFSREHQLAKLDSKEIQSMFDQAISNAMQVASSDLQSNISSQLVSIVVGEVLTQVAIRLGVSAGILGTGAASSWATLGIGLVVGIVIDQIVMTIWNSWSDPEGKLVDSLNQQLDLMQRIICDGDQDTKGLAQHFAEIANSRSSLRRKAVLGIYGIDGLSN